MLSSEEAGEEFIPVPACVARVLHKAYEGNAASLASRQDVIALVEHTSRRLASERIARLVEQREYAARQLRTRLVQEGFGNNVVGKALASAQECGLVNDRRYAEGFIRSKLYAGWGMSRIARELSQRGVRVEDLEGWPYAYLDPEDEYSRALDVAAKKRVSQPNAYAKLVRFLAGRGFSYDVSSRAAQATLESKEEARY